MAQPQPVEKYEETQDTQSVNESPMRQPVPRHLKKGNVSTFEKIVVAIILVGITVAAFNVIRVYGRISELSTSIGRIQTNINTMNSNIDSLQQEKNELSKKDSVIEQAEQADLRRIDENIRSITADEADE